MRCNLRLEGVLNRRKLLNALNTVERLEDEDKYRVIELSDFDKSSFM